MISIGDGKGNTKDVDFYVDENNILQPLQLLVTGDSRHELLPSTRDNTEEIPGRHGEIDFETELKARPLELHVVTPEGLSSAEKKRLARLYASHLDPTKGVKSLVFADEIDKTYLVKYSGKIDPTNYPTWFKFVIPFKMSNPFIIDSFEKTLVGSGKLVNEGTFETGLIIEITGPATNPSLTIGGETLKYTGTIPSGQKLIIDTELETAKIGNNNAMGDYNGNFPLLLPGETIVSVGDFSIDNIISSYPISVSHPDYMTCSVIDDILTVNIDSNGSVIDDPTIFIAYPDKLDIGIGATVTVEYDKLQSMYINKGYYVEFGGYLDQVPTSYQGKIQFNLTLNTNKVGFAIHLYPNYIYDESVFAIKDLKVYGSKNNVSSTIKWRDKWI